MIVLRDLDGEIHHIDEPILDYVTANMLERGEDAYMVGPYDVDCFIGDHYTRSIIFTKVEDALCES